MRYENTTVEQARNTDILTFLSSHAGFTFNSGGNEYRCKEHPSLSVKGDRLTWYWHSRRVGGRGALDFLIKAEGKSFREAMSKLTMSEHSQPVPQIKPSSPHPLILPEIANSLYKRLYAYLNHTRGIDSGVIIALIQEKKLYEDKKGNVVFVGYDENNTPRFASLRGTCTNNPFRMDCAGSDKRYSFSMAYSASERLYVFESPIDAMSHASLANAATGDADAWKQHNRLSLAGTSDTALSFFLSKHSNFKELVFCLDNDLPGLEATSVMVRKFIDKGYRILTEIPNGKDFNDDLIAYRASKAHKKNSNNQQASYTPERIDI